MFYVYKIKGINYIGSSHDINNRTTKHFNSCWNENSKGYNLLVYRYIREKKMKIELEILFCYKGNCSYKVQRLVEQFYINKFDSKNNGLNTFNAFLNKKKYSLQYAKKYREENKETIKETTKKYRAKNKKLLSNKFKKYYGENKEQIKQRNKNLRKENKEKYKQKDKDYYEKNKEEIKAKNKIKINCPICKSLVRKRGLKKHQKTNKCKSFQVAV